MLCLVEGGGEPSCQIRENGGFLSGGQNGGRKMLQEGGEGVGNWAGAGFSRPGVAERRRTEGTPNSLPDGESPRSAKSCWLRPGWGVGGK